MALAQQMRAESFVLRLAKSPEKTHAQSFMDGPGRGIAESTVSHCSPLACVSEDLVPSPNPVCSLSDVEWRPVMLIEECSSIAALANARTSLGQAMSKRLNAAWLHWHAQVPHHPFSVEPPAAPSVTTCLRRGFCVCGPGKAQHNCFEALIGLRCAFPAKPKAQDGLVERDRRIDARDGQDW
jgi:hypothetical protein